MPPNAEEMPAGDLDRMKFIITQIVLFTHNCFMKLAQQIREANKTDALVELVKAAQKLAKPIRDMQQ